MKKDFKASVEKAFEKMNDSFKGGNSQLPLKAGDTLVFTGDVVDEERTISGVKRQISAFKTTSYDISFKDIARANNGLNLQGTNNKERIIAFAEMIEKANGNLSVKVKEVRLQESRYYTSKERYLIFEAPVLPTENAQ